MGYNNLVRMVYYGTDITQARHDDVHHIPGQQKGEHMNKNPPRSSPVKTYHYGDKRALEKTSL